MIRLATIFLLVLLAAATPSLAKDGDGGGDGGGGSSGGNDSGGGGDADDDNGGSSQGHGDDDGSDDDDDDGIEARSSVSSGAILPLASILAGIEGRYDARMIDAELRQRRGRIEYDLELLTRDGRLLDMRVDAKTARILSVEVD